MCRSFSYNPYKLKKHKSCINLYRPWRILDVINYVAVELFIIRGARLAQLLTMHYNIVTFFAKQSLDSIHWRLSTDTR